MNGEIVGGADEAGRGPVLGPMVICAAFFHETDIPFLQEKGVTDSKQLSPKRREELVEVITSKAVDYELVVLSPEDINKGMTSGTNLNELEVNAFARAIGAVVSRGTKPGIIWVDAADVKPERFGERINSKLPTRLTIDARHKADATFTAVGAASILAKTKRDQIISEIAKQYGEIGSGYPADPKTRAFLKTFYTVHQAFPPIIRTEWETIKQLKKEMGITSKGQSRLF
jgi:ribonuclease HII